MLDREEGAVDVVCALRFNTMRGEVALQAAEAIKAVFAKPIDAKAQRELLAGARLVQVRTAGVDSRKASPPGAKRGGSGRSKRKGCSLANQPISSGRRPRFECVGRKIEEAGARAAAQVFVAAADHEVGAHGGDIDRERADGVVGVDEQTSAVLMAVRGEASRFGRSSPVAKSTCETTMRSTPLRILSKSGERSRRPSAAWHRDEFEFNAPDGGVLLEDDVDGIELAVGREHARHAWQRVEDGAQALARGGLRDDAVGARRADELREPRAVRVVLVHPPVPRIAEMRLPELDALAHVVLRLVRAGGRASGSRDRFRAARACARRAERCAREARLR